MIFQVKTLNGGLCLLRVLVSLSNIQDHLENPFDGVG